MRIVRKLHQGATVPPTWLVRCDLCGAELELRCWQHQITPERKCAECATKERVARLRGAA
jgi:hypothetical protein